MKIHHYTNLEILALVLRNKNIRFNRLDKVDDIEEGNISPDGVKIGKYTFVSCWTENDEENISLWKMYSGGGIGVRISLEQDMFKEYVFSNLGLDNGLYLSGTARLKIPLSELERNDWFVFPMFDLTSGIFYKSIEYVSDVGVETRDAIMRGKNIEDSLSVSMYLGKIGKYKHKRWSFQEESRFTIFVFPKNPVRQIEKRNVVNEMITAIYNGEELPIDSCYLELKPEVLDDIIITMNPFISDAQKILVESLCEKYAPNAKIKESNLKHLVRLK